MSKPALAPRPDRNPGALALRPLLLRVPGVRASDTRVWAPGLQFEDTGVWAAPYSSGIQEARTRPPQGPRVQPSRPPSCSGGGELGDPGSTPVYG